MARAAGTRPRVVVVGAGVAGLAAARTAVDLAPGAEVIVLERSPRAGGLVETEQTPDGFLLEHGADCVMTAKPAGVQMARQLGMGDEIVTGEGSRTTYVVRRGRLVPLPAGLAFGAPASPKEMLQTHVLSWPAKIRMGLEPLLAPSVIDQDESVADFVRRRFGRQFLERVMEPLLGGMHGVPAAELSMRACMPRLQELEHAYGSVVVGMRRARARRGAVPAGPAAVSLRRGMQSLPEALALSLGARVRYGREVRQVERRAGGGFRIRLADDDVLDADGVVMAAPAHAAAPMVAPVSAALATLLGAVRHSPLQSVTLGFDRNRVGHPLAGTGFVAPRDEGRPTRACSWASSKWPGRAPEGSVLIRSVLDAPGATDDDLLEAARRDLRELMGIEAEPTLVRVRRRSRALPIYEVGYPARIRSMRSETGVVPGLALAGNAHGGIGVPDCIQSGREAAGAVVSAVA